MIWAVKWIGGHPWSRSYCDFVACQIDIPGMVVKHYQVQQVLILVHASQPQEVYSTGDVFICVPSHHWVLPQACVGVVIGHLWIIARRNPLITTGGYGTVKTLLSEHEKRSLETGKTHSV